MGKEVEVQRCRLTGERGRGEGVKSSFTPPCKDTKVHYIIEINVFGNIFSYVILNYSMNFKLNKH